ncbi:conserved hypothetical protein [Theileria orientalis strain Shintoku]|uniref:SUN domain-containing protein n=1 Tax=Theileria orientalis strain Shintoku TaxID=869250 RepID=J4C2X7_THEOR|nr:conserved hypothetical protein [Theileria orientalis strain Shintoku]PVC53990.1 hypothetical protein MACL_00003356 [Theileria orientalis]BAM39461.1 conserved hypothetical protein [Theileria orientalis strain Shintoku]|eukprot:XP_009689762.1 conserved hypothetical protein [Theileria orientalis strain Shintoku]
MRLMLIYLWIFKIHTNAVKTLTTIDISKDIEDVKIGRHDTNLSNTKEYNVTIKPDLKISKVVDGDIRIWQNAYGGEKCTFCHVWNYKKKPVLVMLFIQQFNDFYVIMRYRLFHGTWVPITKTLYNEISKSIADFTGDEFDLEVDINQRFNPDMLTIHVSAFDQYTSYKLTPAVGYHIDKVRFAQTMLWQRTEYQEEVLEIVLLVNDGRFEYMSIMYETYYETADTIYFKYESRWERTSREDFFHKPDPPRTLKPHVFFSERRNEDYNRPGEGTESASSGQPDDADEVPPGTARFRGLTSRPFFGNTRQSSASAAASGSSATFPSSPQASSSPGPSGLPRSGIQTYYAQPSDSKDAQDATPKQLSSDLFKKPEPPKQKHRLELNPADLVRPWERTHKVRPPLTTGGSFSGSRNFHHSAHSKFSPKGYVRVWKGLAPATFCYPSQVARDMSRPQSRIDSQPSTSKDQPSKSGGRPSSSSEKREKDSKDSQGSGSEKYENPATSFSYRQTRSRGSIYRPMPVYLCDHNVNQQPPEVATIEPTSGRQSSPISELITSVYPELSGENPDLTDVPENYMSILERSENQLESDLSNFEEYLEEFEEYEFTNKRHKRRKGDSNFFQENEKIKTDVLNGVALNLHEIHDSHPDYIVECQSYYGVPVFKITPTGSVHFNSVLAGDKIAWTNHNFGTCHVVKAVVMNGRYSAIEILVKRISNLSYLHYKYEKGYYTSVHTPTYMTFVTKYAAELYEEYKKRAENIQDRLGNREEREKMTQAILKEQEEISKECYKQYMSGETTLLESGVEPFSLTAKRRIRVRKRKKPSDPPANS